MHKYLRNTLLLFQQQHYKLAAFFSQYTHRFPSLRRQESRQQLDRTPKLLTILSISTTCIIGILIQIVVTTSYPATYIVLIGILIFFPLYFPVLLSLSNLLLKPFEYVVTQYIITKTRKKIAQHSSLHIIGIVGSYGKTSMKNMLEHILSQHLKVFSIPGNLNTPLGISRSIRSGLTTDHQVLLIEMGEMHRGDIAELCTIVSPSIGVITGITQQHLDTFGTIENIISTIFEITDFLPAGGMLYANTHSEYVRRGLEHTQPESKYTIVPMHQPKDDTYKNDLQGITFSHDGHTLSCPLLGLHNATALCIAYEVAKHLGMLPEKIHDAIATMPHISHRLQPIYNPFSRITVIDDTYNGNREGVQSALDLLAHLTPLAGGKRWYLTPGLVELGNETAHIHTRIGELLANSADRIILIKSRGTKYIRDALDQKGFPAQHIFEFPTTAEAHAALGSLLSANDIILFQNDIPDFIK